VKIKILPLTKNLEKRKKQLTKFRAGNQQPKCLVFTRLIFRRFEKKTKNVANVNIITFYSEILYCLDFRLDELELI
jgi:hypothetical protein